MSKKRNKGLGVGALLSGINTEINPPKQEFIEQLSHTIANIPIEQVEVNPYQPRVEFDEQALQDLENSIREHGLIQPITVRHLPPDRFQLISGERRLRASKRAGLKEIPAYIRVANDETMLEMALIENIQREDLNAIEVSLTYQRLMEEFKLTQDALSKRIGKGRATIANYIRLLKLPPEIQKGLKKSHISMGHARALITIGDIALQMSVYKEIIEKGLSVRQVEALVKRYMGQNNTKETEKKTTPKLPLAHLKVQNQLQDFLRTKVVLTRKDNGQGQILINYLSDEDLNRILDLLDNEE